jgi:DNA-binding NarL/FixJ family response regulator
MVTVRVVIIDDHAVVRNGLRNNLTCCADIEVAAEAGSVEEALQQAQTLQPDILLLDVSMAGLDLAAFMTQVGTMAQPPRVIAFTSDDHAEHIQTAIAAGVTGYLLNRVSGEVVADTIRRVAAGETVLSDDAAQILAQQAIEQAQRPAPPKFTDRELEVLRLVAKGQTNQETGATLHISRKAVEKHLSAIFLKLGVASRTAAVATAMQQGLL